jgi:LemA protein
MSKGSKIGLIILVAVIVLVIIIVLPLKNMYNGFVTNREQVNGTWAQVQNAYQRRADLIPNLVETVKGYAAHERETLEAVIEARSKVGGITQLNADDLTPENLAKFQQAQAGLSSALQRLMVVVEQYPNLKANENFINLQDQLTETENMILQARRKFNEQVLTYNQNIQIFPNNLFAGMFGFKIRPYFEADQQAQTAPKVEF